MEYWVSRRCKSCGQEDKLELTKLQSAFELYDTSTIWTQLCSVCKSDECESLHHPLVKLDQELLDIWGNNPHLAMMSQDEELLLAEIEYLPIILRAIDNKEYLPSKVNVLLEALCILVYDNLANASKYSPEENLKRKQIADLVKPELVERKTLVENASAFIRDYIKEIVFPEIGLTKNEA